MIRVVILWLAVASSVLSAIVQEMSDTGPSTRENSYLTMVQPNMRAVSILTAGETTLDESGAPYRFVGVSFLVFWLFFLKKKKN